MPSPPALAAIVPRNPRNIDSSPPFEPHDAWPALATVDDPFHDDWPHWDLATPNEPSSAQEMRC